MIKYFNDHDRSCKCTNPKNIKFSLGAYLCIDVSDAYTALAESLSTLDEISATIKIKEETFILCGAARYVPGHFIAYVKSRGTWIEKNDLVDARRILTEAQVKNLKMQICYLFYVNTKEVEKEILLQIYE